MRKIIRFAVSIIVCLTVCFSALITAPSYAGFLDGVDVMGDTVEGKWKDSKGNIYFYKDSQKLFNTWVYYYNSYYFVQANGKAKTSGTKTQNGIKYSFASSGVATVTKNKAGQKQYPGAITLTQKSIYDVGGNSTWKGESTPEKDTTVKSSLLGTKKGWVKDNGYWYYYVNGKPYKDTIKKIDGYYYGFYEDGKMIPVKGACIFKGHTVRVKDTDGHLCRNEWFQVNNKTWEYYGSDCYKVFNKKVNGFWLDDDGYWYDN